MMVVIEADNNVTAVQKPIKQLAVTVLTQLVSWVFAMIVTFVLPRYRTVPEFAIFSVMFGYTSLVNSIGDNGISALVSRSGQCRSGIFMRGRNKLERVFPKPKPTRMGSVDLYINVKH